MFKFDKLLLILLIGICLIITIVLLDVVIDPVNLIRTVHAQIIATESPIPEETVVPTLEGSITPIPEGTVVPTLEESNAEMILEIEEEISRQEDTGWDVFISEGFAFEIHFPIEVVQKKSILNQDAVNSGAGFQTQAPVWQFRLDKPVYYQGTNLIDASLLIHVLVGQEQENQCSSFKQGSIFQTPNQMLDSLVEVVINGISYKVDEVIEGVMGEFYHRISYRTFANDACYELTQLLQYRNMDSLVDSTIIEFDQSAVLGELNQVLDTFTILDIEPTFPEQSYPLPETLSSAVAKSVTGNVDGLDVSHWQGTINWTKVANAGYVFTFAKGTEGVGWTDTKFTYNMNSGDNAGVMMGVYHFARPDLGNSGAAEANYFLSVAGDYLKSGYLRPVLDLEVGTSLGKTALSNWVLEWMQTVKDRTGIEPLIYTNLNYINNYLTDAVTQYDLWIAYWSCSPTPTYYIPPTGKWRDWAFWQYYGPGGCGGNAGYVPGITTNIDLNIFNGVESGLQEYDASSHLWVSLSSDAYNVPAPYYADITANVNGDTTGPIEYAFWWDCPSLESDISLVEGVCGVLPVPAQGNCLKNEVGMRCIGINNELQLAEYTYQEIGNYTAKVIVKRGAAAPAEDRYKISTYNPITGIRVYPESPGAGTANYPYILYTRSFLTTSVAGAYSLEIIQPATGETLGSRCRQVPGDARLEELFNFTFTNSQAGLATYEIWARYRAGGTCPIVESSEDDQVWNYSINWGLGEFDLRRLDGSVLINGGQDDLGEIRISYENTALYLVKNNSPSASLIVHSLTTENPFNVTVIHNTEGLVVEPLSEAAVGITYQVDETGPFHFDIVILHNEDLNNPYRISVEGEGISPFMDINTNYWAYDAIEQLRVTGITSGCEQTPQQMFCPDDPVSRAEMAVFLEKVVQGVSFLPVPGEGALPFDDIEGHWAEYWIIKLKQDGFTSGCSPANYCPEIITNRAEMAIFLLRLKYGVGFIPPRAQGIVFNDVPADYWAVDWIEKLAADGITSGCDAGKYCPNRGLSRAEMAVLLIRTISQMD